MYILWHQQNKWVTSQDTLHILNVDHLVSPVPSVADTKKSYGLGIIHKLFHLSTKELIIDHHPFFYVLRERTIQEKKKPATKELIVLEGTHLTWNTQNKSNQLIKHK